MNKQYYKPHFGPEETQETIARMRQSEANKTEQQFNAIRDQVTEQVADSEQRRRQERDNDAAFLRNTTRQQEVEDAQRREKDALNKQNLKRAWMEQMQYRRIHEQTDKIFY